MKFGDIYQYKEPVIHGRKTDDHIVLGVTDNHVICTLVSFFHPTYLNSRAGENYQMPVRRITKEDFALWYPKHIGNLIEGF